MSTNEWTSGNYLRGWKIKTTMSYFRIGNSVDILGSVCKRSVDQNRWAARKQSTNLKKKQKMNYFICKYWLSSPGPPSGNYTLNLRPISVLCVNVLLPSYGTLVSMSYSNLVYNHVVYVCWLALLGRDLTIILGIMTQQCKMRLETSVSKNETVLWVV